MVNYFNFKSFDDNFLITNDFGRYAFVSQIILKKLVLGTISNSDTEFSMLKDNFFITDEHPEVFIRKVSPLLQDIKSYVLAATSLHIFAVTNNCNQNCVYCQAKDIETKQNGMMSIETGEKAIDLALSSPSKYLTFEFQGGEPLLNFDVVKHMIEYSKKNRDKEIQYTIISNLALLNDDILDFLIENKVNICTSVDGSALIHNQNRPLKNGAGSFEYARHGIELIKERGQNPGAIQTTTRFGLGFPKESVDAYVDLGLSSIFIRPLTPLGFARAYWEEIGYTPEEYLAFYKEALDYIIDINKDGKYFPEIHTVYFLKKILAGLSVNYMELRSPCGASIGQMSYYYDGSVYTCDEGRMLSEAGDCSFRLGNVHENTYNDLMNSPVCKATCVASVTEGLPACCDCVYQPYCGVCPVVNYAEGKNIFPQEPRNFRCRIYKGMMDILFDKILKNDEEEMNILRSWL